ncbi:MAG: tol-pal system-associated acyl-CoA thioesterase [Methylococcales bacterium]|nr:tol-pal system-associated acyl-CoA thioesterase [Methylococcales bacterium]
MTSPFIFPIRIYYEDTDAGGVVYHSNYLNFFERARTEMLRNLGFEHTKLHAEYGVIFAVKAIACDFIRPAKFDDFLHTSSEINQVKKASLIFEQTLKRDEITLCTASCKIVCLKADTFQPTAIPDFLYKQFLTKSNEH